MFAWLLNDLATVIICAALAVCVVLIVVYEVKKKKSGASACGCGCNACRTAEKCRSGNKKD